MRIENPGVAPYEKQALKIVNNTISKALGKSHVTFESWQEFQDYLIEAPHNVLIFVNKLVLPDENFFTSFGRIANEKFIRRTVKLYASEFLDPEGLLTSIVFPYKSVMYVLTEDVIPANRMKKDPILLLQEGKLMVTTFKFYLEDKFGFSETNGA